MYVRRVLQVILVEGGNFGRRMQTQQQQHCKTHLLSYNLDASFCCNVGLKICDSTRHGRSGRGELGLHLVMGAKGEILDEGCRYSSIGTIEGRYSVAI